MAVKKKAPAPRAKAKAKAAPKRARPAPARASAKAKTSTKAPKPAPVAIDRAAELARVAAVVRRHLPKGYREVSRGAMTVWEVPLEVYPDTYNGHALWYAAMAPNKSYLTLHLMGAYGSPVLAKRLADGFKAAGKKLDMGKACIHFQKADDLALDAIADVVAAVPMDTWVAMAKAVRARR